MRVLVSVFLCACLLPEMSNGQRGFAVDGGGDDYYNDVSSDEEDNYPQKASINDGRRFTKITSSEVKLQIAYHIFQREFYQRVRNSIVNSLNSSK